MNATLRLVTALALIVSAAGTAAAQQRGRSAGDGAAQSPRASAPIDLTGYWVSIVNEDWRWRMITPLPKDYASIGNLMTPEAQKIAGAWTPDQDGSCLAYGAAGLMRMPTRLNVTWENDTMLTIETDAGQQTRRLNFDRAAAPGPRSLQGLSIAGWERPGGRAAARTGSLKVVTTNLSGGWLRRNGVPYSENATVTEYFDRFATAAGDDWMVVTTIVSDPKYLNQEFITSSHFRKEADGAKKWDPTPCTSSP